MNATQTHNELTHTFETEDAASEAAKHLNTAPGVRRDIPVAMREGLRVYIRPEFASRRLIGMLAELAMCYAS